MIHILQPCNSFTLYGTQTRPVNMVQHKEKEKKKGLALLTKALTVN